MSETYRIGGGWGNAINWFDTEHLRVVGWKPRKPQPGDLLESKMQSGRIGVYAFGAIEPCADPYDMFFAHVWPLGYKDDLEESA